MMLKLSYLDKISPKLSYFDPSGAHGTNVKRNHASLVFHMDTTIMNNTNNSSPVSKDSLYSKALPEKMK
jgi:hypothetical protein